MTLPRPVVVGILNCTPDSFHDGGRFGDLDSQLHQIETLLAEGADWIDIGGESTRPGAAEISPEEELARVLPIIQDVSSHVPISIDSSKPRVVKAALAAGARFINDVTGLQDPAMVDLSAEAEGTVIMHSRGTPRDMAGRTTYTNLIIEVREWLMERSERCRSEKIWLDPGLGFAKTAKQSLAILQSVDLLALTGFPIYIGASRKSFIGQTLDLPNTESRLPASIAAACLAYERGATVFRVHDVAPTRQALDLMYAVKRVAPATAC